EGQGVRSGAGPGGLCAGQGAPLGEERSRRLDLVVRHLAQRMELSRGICAPDERVAAPRRPEPGCARALSAPDSCEVLRLAPGRQGAPDARGRGMTEPELVVVVDTEEEFDWKGDFSRSATATRS